MIKPVVLKHFDALDGYDRAWELASDLTEQQADAEAKARRCPACGGDATECQDPDNQHAYEVALKRCYRSRAINDTLKTRKDDPDKASLIITAHLNPAKKKSARRKG